MNAHQPLPPAHQAPAALSFLGKYAFLILICAVFFVVGLLRLNDYSFLTPDSSLYLIWGNAVAHGHGLVDYTLPVPDRFVSRGVLYSILLAPIEAVFPHSLIAAKVFTLCLAVVALIVLYRWLEKKLGSSAAIAGTLLLAANPLLLIYGTEVLSEIPFLCCVLLSTIFIERIADSPGRNDSFRDGLALGLTLAAAALFRDIGMSFLIAALAVLTVFRKPKQALTVLAVCGSLLGIWYVRNKLLVQQTDLSQTGYLPWFFTHVGTPASASFASELWWRISTSGSIYCSQFAGMLLYPLFATRQFVSLLPSAPHAYAIVESAAPVWSWFVIAAILPLIVLGIFRDLRNYKSGWYRLGCIVVYLGIVLCFPFNDIRYHVPLLPFFVYYNLSGALVIGERFRNIAASFTPPRALGLALFCMIPNLFGIFVLVSANLEYMSKSDRHLPAMGVWIRSHLPEDAVIACAVKDLATEIGPRKLINIDPSVDRPEFERLLRDNSVSCIVTPILAQGGMIYEFAMRESARFAFDTLHTTGSLVAWSAHSSLLRLQVRSALLRPDSSNANVGDGSEQHAPILAARTAILSGHYEDAMQLLRPIGDAQPDRADVFYQMLIASCLLRDTTQVHLLYNRIVSLPSWSGIYIFPAQRQMDALNAVVAMEQSTEPARSLNAVQAASMYWRMGYQEVAVRILDENTLEDSTYFVGLLWGMDFNLQCGDTAKARWCLHALESMDRSNPVVVGYDSIFTIIDSLRTSISPLQASDLQLHVARIYQAIELPDEACDQAERALALNPRNASAMILLGQMFESRAKYPAAARWFNTALAIDPSNTDARVAGQRVAAILNNLTAQ